MNPYTKLTKQAVESCIRNVTYTRLPSGCSIVCEITLPNLHRVHGIASVIDLENYDEKLGKEAAYAKALDELFKVLSYVKHESMYTGLIDSNHVALVAEWDAQPNYTNCILKD